MLYLRVLTAQGRRRNAVTPRVSCCSMGATAAIDHPFPGPPRQRTEGTAALLATYVEVTNLPEGPDQSGRGRRGPGSRRKKRPPPTTANVPRRGKASVHHPSRVRVHLI